MKTEAEFYDTFYSDSPNAFEENPAQRYIANNYFQNMIRTLREYKDLKRSRVLSIGCGTGRFELLLAPYVQKIVGIDVSKKGIELARKRNDMKNLRFQVASATKLPFKKNEYDIVLSLSMIHHIKDQSKAIREIRRVLKKDGVFFGIEPNRNGLVHKFGNLLVPELYHKIHSPDEKPIDPFVFGSRLKSGGFVLYKHWACDFFLGPLLFVVHKKSQIFHKVFAFINRILFSLPFVKRYSCEFMFIAR